MFFIVYPLLANIFLECDYIIVESVGSHPRQNGTLPGSRKNSKPEKCAKMAQNPTSRVHAVSAVLCKHKHSS